MIVGLVLEQQQPGLGLPVHGHIHLHRAGVDLLALVQLLQLTPLPQHLSRHGGQIHEAQGPVLPTQFLPGVQIPLPGAFQQLIREGDLVDLRQEGGMPAMIAPVGIQHADLGDGGLPALLPEIPLAEGDVVRIHGQAVVGDELRQPRLIQGAEARQGGHVRGNGVFRLQGFRPLQRSLPGFHRVDHIPADRRDFISRQIPVQQVYLRAADQGALPLAEDLDALGRGVRPLVELPRQVLHRKHRGGFRAGPDGLQGIIGQVHRRLGQHFLHRRFEQRFRQVLQVVPVQEPDPLQARNAQEIPGVVQQAPGLVILARFFLHVYSVDHNALILSV